MVTVSLRSATARSLLCALLLGVILLQGAMIGSVAATTADFDGQSGVSGDSSVNSSAINATATIEDLTIDSSDTFTHNGTRAIWNDSDFSVSVRVRADQTNNDYYDVCLLERRSDGDTSHFGCNTTSLTTRGTAIRFDVSSNQTIVGRHQLIVTASSSFGSGSLSPETRQASLFVLNKTADLDSDQLSNIREHKLGLNLTNSDTDGDGLTDGAEVNVHGTDPGNTDTDTDGAPDNVEVNGKSNATLADTDGDGVLDGRELELNTDPTSPHSDEDSLADARELEVDTDPLQADSDSDGLDDGRELEVGTDPLVADTDGDGVLDGREVEIGSDPLDTDTDGDFLRDGMELLIGLNPTSALQTVLLVFAASGLLALAGYLLYRYDGLGIGVETGGGDVDDDSSAAEAPPEPTPADSESSSDQSEGPPIELLTPPDRIHRILDQNDGHVPQADIVDETDWSKAKVSRTLSKMEEAGDVDRYRLGRGNVVTYPDVDPVENALSDDEES